MEFSRITALRPQIPSGGPLLPSENGSGSASLSAAGRASDVSAVPFGCREA